MFYSNTLNLKNVNYKKHSINGFKGVDSNTDENLLSLKNSPLSYNFDYSNGSLKDGLGIGKLRFRYELNSPDEYREIPDLPNGAYYKGCWLFNYWDNVAGSYKTFLILYTSRGEFYYVRMHGYSGDLKRIEGLSFQERPIVASYKLDGIDTLILVSQKDGMYIWQYPDMVRKIENAPSISSMCVHNERLFVTTHGEKRAVWFSDDLNPINFNVSSLEGGYIEMADDFGRCNKVLSFEGYLYIIRDFNIARVVAYANQEEFIVSQLYTSNAKIHENTVCVCGNKILYLASDGVYVFNGSSATKLKLGIEGLLKGIDNNQAVAAYSNGYYYLSCRLNFNDGMVVGMESISQSNRNNALLKINVSDGSLSIMRGYCIEDFFVINDTFKNQLCATVAYSGILKLSNIENNGKYFENDTVKVWRSPYSNFGYPDRYKLIRQITLETLQDIEVEIKTENKTKVIKVLGKDKPQNIMPYIKGKKISISFISRKSDNLISCPSIVVGYL